MPIASSELPGILASEFPELQADLQEDGIRGLVHLEMGTFAEFVQRAKGRADWDVYGRALRLADRLLREGEPALENAVHVSFLEQIDFNGPRGQDAWRLLSPELQRAWRRINDGWGRPRPNWMR